MKNTQENDRAERQAKTQLESITEMVEALDTEDDEKREKVETAIQEDPLSVQIRSGWYNPGDTPGLEEYEILLCTGGPAVRIIGKLGKYNEPETASLQYQDWFIPWADYRLTTEEEEILVKYAQAFYFGQ